MKTEKDLLAHDHENPIVALYLGMKEIDHNYGNETDFDELCWAAELNERKELWVNR